MHGLLELCRSLLAEGVALRDKALAHFRQAQCFVHCMIELVDDGRVCALGRKNAEPDGAVEALGAGQAAGGNGGHFLDGFHRFGCGHTQQAHLACLVVRQHALHLIHDAASLAAHHGANGIRATFVGHMNHVQPQAGVEFGKRHVRACAVARGGKVVLAGVGLDLVHELLEGLDVDDVGIDGQHIGHVHQRSNGHKVGLNVEGQLFVQRCIAAVRGGCAEVEGVAIGFGASNQFAADIACSTGLVVNDDGLAQQLAHGLLHHAAHHVHARASIEAHDHGDGLMGIAGSAVIGGLSGQGKQGGCRGSGSKTGEEAGQQTHGETCPDEP